MVLYLCSFLKDNGFQFSILLYPLHSLPFPGISYTNAVENTLKTEPIIPKYHLSIWWRLLKEPYYFSIILNQGRVLIGVKPHFNFFRTGKPKVLKGIKANMKTIWLSYLYTRTEMKKFNL
jgi:hypothetical protein